MLTDDALLRFEKVSALRSPNCVQVEVLREWLEHPKGGDFFLRGIEANTWSDGCADDMVSFFKHSFQEDRFSAWFTQNAMSWFHLRLGYRFKVCSRTWIGE